MGENDFLMAGQLYGVNLLDALRVAPGPDSVWTGTAILGGDGVAFGGQMAAQALMAARAVEPGRPPESIHSFFLAPAKPDRLIDHEVRVLRSGRSFSLLRVETRQEGRHCLSSVISFHGGESAPEHQAPMPPAGSPEDYPACDFIPPNTDPAVRRCFDIRSVESIASTSAGSYPRQTYWLRHRGELGADPALHCAALTWFADLSMPWTTDLAYDESHGRRVGATLDHTLWFHRPPRADRWLLFVQESTVYAGARALTRGLFFAQDGALVASAAQETLLRRLPPQ
ncbi:acyl-CoA thioesterase domain-containing protein [Tsuneonella sp. CC-YZS046]|jgi:acyl-CoA thioesterase-2|uniref:acyl-CoA thioesterase n=1 Tax=Tsuneonella sp. CC-YZS046 TaxID=3042152 RepID=UPI002D775888|nr:acyl-CoA thioesterase domain-containing protein [Tsuneonella sp. CC-YZS046]WRO66217.1 acyl-CoA thioesterase domain-containing protein [Tsuneonella sp. CC-YZS046]